MGRGFQRRSIQREQIDTILIVCGGKTEENYFGAFPVKTKVVRVKITGHDVGPKRLVKRAINERDKQAEIDPGYNQVWCVFDKDEFTDEAFNKAVEFAGHNGIHVACSNQSFELWYCLHFDRIAPPLHRKQYVKKLEKIWGEYENLMVHIFRALKKTNKSDKGRRTVISYQSPAYTGETGSGYTGLSVG